MTINVPYIDSMKNAKLDINEGSLVFEYPSLFYLDLNLKYKCNRLSAFNAETVLHTHHVWTVGAVSVRTLA